MSLERRPSSSVSISTSLGVTDDSKSSSSLVKRSDSMDLKYSPSSQTRSSSASQNPLVKSSSRSRLIPPVIADKVDTKKDKPNLPDWIATPNNKLIKAAKDLSEMFIKLDKAMYQEESLFYSYKVLQKIVNKKDILLVILEQIKNLQAIASDNLDDWEKKKTELVVKSAELTTQKDDLRLAILKWRQEWQRKADLEFKLSNDAVANFSVRQAEFMQNNKAFIEAKKEFDVLRNRFKRWQSEAVKEKAQSDFIEKFMDVVAFNPVETEGGRFTKLIPSSRVLPRPREPIMAKCPIPDEDELWNKFSISAGKGAGNKDYDLAKVVVEMKKIAILTGDPVLIKQANNLEKEVTTHNQNQKTFFAEAPTKVKKFEEKMVEALMKEGSEQIEVYNAQALKLKQKSEKAYADIKLEEEKITNLIRKNQYALSEAKTLFETTYKTRHSLDSDSIAIGVTGKLLKSVYVGEGLKGGGLFLMSTDKDAKLDKSDLQTISKQYNDSPILIKQGDKFSIYGYLNNKWQLSDLGLTATESEFFKNLPFAKNQLIEKNNPILTSGIVSILKRGHTQTKLATDFFDLINGKNGDALIAIKPELIGLLHQIMINQFDQLVLARNKLQYICNNSSSDVCQVAQKYADAYKQYGARGRAEQANQFKIETEVRITSRNGRGLFLMSADEDAKLDERYLQTISKQHKDSPILIKKGDKFSIYGYLNNNWQLSDLGLTAAESEFFKNLPFAKNQLIEENNPLLTSDIANILKRGHTPRDNYLQQASELITQKQTEMMHIRKNMAQQKMVKLLFAVITYATNVNLWHESIDSFWGSSTKIRGITVPRGISKMYEDYGIYNGDDRRLKLKHGLRDPIDILKALKKTAKERHNKGHGIFAKRTLSSTDNFYNILIKLNIDNPSQDDYRLLLTELTTQVEVIKDGRRLKLDLQGFVDAEKDDDNAIREQIAALAALKVDNDLSGQLRGDVVSTHQFLKDLTEHESADEIAALDDVDPNGGIASKYYAAVAEGVAQPTAIMRMKA